MSSPRTTPPNQALLDVNTTRLSRTLLIVCLIVELSFVVLDYIVNYGRLTEIGALRRMFNIAREDGLASWFAVTQTIFVALTSWLVYATTKRGDGPRSTSLGWLVVALLFTYMAVDDGAQIHERLGTTFERMGDASGTSFDFFPSYTWQILFLPVFAALGLFVLVFLWRELERRSPRGCVLLAMSLFALAVGLDFFEGLNPDHRFNVYSWLAANTDWDSWTQARFQASAYDALRHFSRAIEESMEMAANSILWFVFLRYLGARRADIHLRFRE